ncbi:MAG: hypothetical protein JO029_04120 [Candidatus Eremiobacteraeota bacterium]|nr:hypothetical protein [Candidatus Eremiobacteraeota bacterium]
MTKRVLDFAFPALVALTVAACSTGANVQPLQSNALPSFGSAAPHAFAPSSTYLYVADPAAQEVVVFDPNYNVVKTYTTGLAKPAADFVDTHGNLFVANESDCTHGNVVEYPHGATSPSFTYTQRLSCPVAVGADKSGNVYVFDAGPGANGTTTIFKFKPGKNKVASSWNACNHTLYTVCYPEGLTIGRNNWVYTTIWGILPGGKPSGYWVFDILIPSKNQQGYLTGWYNPAGGTAIDKRLNVLAGAWPASCGGGAPTGNEDIVQFPYPYHGSDWCPVFLGPGGFVSVTGLALSLDQSLLYVADYGAATVSVLTYPSGTLVTTLGFANGLSDPQGVAGGPAP